MQMLVGYNINIFVSAVSVRKLSLERSVQNEPVEFEPMKEIGMVVLLNNQIFRYCNIFLLQVTIYYT